VLLAGFLDLIDGRVARLLKGTSKFGAQLDSLADFFNFGITPAFILYFWQLKNIHHVGWIVSIIFAVCVALRLARFNVMLEDDTKPAYMANFFSGMPSPAGGICVMLPIYLDHIGLSPTFLHPPIVAAFTLVIALLMVSTVPVFSGKQAGARVPRDKVILIFVAVVAIISLFAFYTWQMMSLAVLLYLGSIPYGISQANKQKNEEIKLNETPAAPPE
jgi:CDP-diacylglycerol--serine O-phosphatidyltransferase